MTTGGFLLRAISLGFLLIMVLAAAPIHSAFAQAPVKIRVGWITAPASLVPLLFIKPGVTKHHGKSYMFEPMHFASSTLQITALSQGELDLAAFGYTSFPLAIQNAGLSDLRIIADEIQDGAPGYYSNAVFRAQGFRDRQDRGHARQDRRDQRPRQRRRHRHAHRVAPARARGAARLHDDRGAVPHP